MHTILLIEDDDALRYSTARHLTAAGYDVVAAANTMTALHELGSGRKIDLVLSDIVMPKGQPHGLSLARMARMRNPGIHVIFMTGYHGIADDETGLPGPVLAKPLDLGELTKAIGAKLAV